MPLRKELSEFANIPGVTKAFVKHQSQVIQQHCASDTATADWIVNHCDLGYLPLQIQIPWQLIYNEAESVISHMIAYPATDHVSQGWSNFGLYTRGPDDLGDLGRTTIDLNNEWTQQAKQLMPRTVEYFTTLWPHRQFHKIRLLGLAPMGVIGLHSDDCDGLHNINIAINHPAQCDFVLENSGIIPFENGRAFLVNTGRRHAVVNHSNHLRIHLVIYQDNDHVFEKMIVESYEKYTKAS